MQAWCTAAEVSSSVYQILARRLGELGEPVAAGLAQLRLRGADVVLSLLQYVDPERSETHGTALPTPVVAWLARAGACISIDQYMADDEEDDAEDEDEQDDG